jgi:hypothetical protein
MHRFSLAAIAALSLAAAPATAQSLEPSPAAFSRYASLGAITFAAEARRLGHPELTCIAWRHLLWLEERDGTSEDEKARTRRMIHSACTLY